jgi:four helix bundle protein
MSDSLSRTLAKDFAKQIVFLSEELKSTKKEYTMSMQLLRSGTSIGANLHEARYAQSNMDFISKLEIALKECYETEYWLELLFETNYIEKQRFEDLFNTCGKIRRLLISSVKTSKNKQ